jgi:hypothetical protein
MSISVRYDHARFFEAIRQDKLRIGKLMTPIMLSFTFSIKTNRENLLSQNQTLRRLLERRPLMCNWLTERVEPRWLQNNAALPNTARLSLKKQK